MSAACRRGTVEDVQVVYLTRRRVRIVVVARCVVGLARAGSGSFNIELEGGPGAGGAVRSRRKRKESI